MITELLDILLHLDAHLNNWVILFGPGIYAILFLVIFCETGLVVTPFLPGDSLLFALGALTAVDNAFLQIKILLPSLLVAAIIGDITNYSIGRSLGERILQKNWRYFNRKHYDKTHAFYEKNGGRTIVLARFMPIVRTFAPFVAGVARMSYQRFIGFSVFGGATWISSFLFAGHYFGNLPSIKSNFHIVILAIVVISFVPVVAEWCKARKAA